MDALPEEVFFHLVKGAAVRNGKPAEVAGRLGRQVGGKGIKKGGRFLGQSRFLMQQFLGRAGQKQFRHDFRIKRRGFYADIGKAFLYDVFYVIGHSAIGYTEPRTKAFGKACNIEKRQPIRSCRDIMSPPSSARSQP